MIIQAYDSGLLHSNMFVISEGGHAIVVDPCSDTKPGKNFIVDWIILTHEHYDHISGVNVWKKETGATVMCSKSCANRLGDPKMTMARFFSEFCQLQTWVKLESVPKADTEYRCEADQTFEKEYNLTWKGHEIILKETPGHSPGSIVILMDNQFLFSGDTLFSDRHIEVRFPGGSMRQWKEYGEPVIEKLPKGLLVYPGHFAPFFLEGQEKRKEG